MACYGMPADEYDRYDAGPDGSSQQDDAGNTDAGNSDAGTDASVSTDAGGDANSLDAGADSADDASTSDAGTDGG
jgi:cobalamin biosynthesis protein CobT